MGEFKDMGIPALHSWEKMTHVPKFAQAMQECPIHAWTATIQYYFVDELLSNDPPNKENPYKSFFTQIGSARPIRGANFRTPIMKLSMDWTLVKISSEK
jgi:hypothetical protein